MGRNKLEIIPVALMAWRAPCSCSLLLGGWQGERRRQRFLGRFGALQGAGTRRAGRWSHQRSDNLLCQARRGILGSGILSPLLSLYPARVRACRESGHWQCPATLGGPACQAANLPPAVGAPVMLSGELGFARLMCPLCTHWCWGLCGLTAHTPWVLISPKNGRKRVFKAGEG